MSPPTGTLARRDGRTREARLLRAIRAELTEHVGGHPSATQRIAIERAAALTLHVARMDEAAAVAGGMSDHARREYLAADSSLRRMLQLLGTQGKAQRSPTIHDLLASDRARGNGAEARPAA